MTRLDPFAFMRPSAKTETRTFTDPAHPDAPITLTLTVEPGNDTALNLALMERRNEYVALYIEGKNGNPPVTLPPIGGRQVRLSESLLATIAFLEISDTPADGEEKYDLIQWLAFAVNLPSAFEEIVEWAVGLRAEATQDPKA